MKIAITPCGFDDIATVIKSSNFDLDINNISFDFLKKGELGQYKVIFINCNSDIPSLASTVSENIKKYVNDGGLVYASDYAAPIIQNIFPGQVEFESNTSSMEVLCDVIDDGLKSFLGNQQAKINFNMGGWYKTTKLEISSKIFLQHKKLGPILFSIKHGEGSIFYTSFHNDAQVDLNKDGAIDFLAIRPLLENAVDNLYSEVEAQKAEVYHQQITKILDNETKSFNFKINHEGRYRLIFKPTYQAKIKVKANYEGKEINEEIQIPGYIEIETASATNIDIKITNTTESRKGVPLAFALTDNWDKPTNQPIKSSGKSWLKETDGLPKFTK